MAAVSALLVLPVPDYDGITGGARRHEGALLLLTIIVLVSAGPLVLVGVPLTWAYMRWPRALTRRSYYVALFLVLVANVVLVSTGGWRYALTECRPCEGGFVFWPKTVLVASLFIVFAPYARGLTSQRDR